MSFAISRMVEAAFMAGPHHQRWDANYAAVASPQKLQCLLPLAPVLTSTDFVECIGIPVAPGTHSRMP